MRHVQASFGTQNVCCATQGTHTQYYRDSMKLLLICTHNYICWLLFRRSVVRWGALMASSRSTNNLCLNTFFLYITRILCNKACHSTSIKCLYLHAIIPYLLSKQSNSFYLHAKLISCSLKMLTVWTCLKSDKNWRGSSISSTLKRKCSLGHKKQTHRCKPKLPHEKLRLLPRRRNDTFLKCAEPKL